MADAVYQALDRMLPALEDLQIRGLFTAVRVRDGCMLGSHNLLVLRDPTVLFFIWTFHDAEVLLKLLLSCLIALGAQRLLIIDHFLHIHVFRLSAGGGPRNSWQT